MKTLSLRQYPVQIHEDVFKNPTVEEFTKALHVLSVYMRDVMEYIPFVKELADDLSKNDSETVIHYAISAMESDSQHAIKPRLLIAMLEGIKNTAKPVQFLVLAEKILENYECNIEVGELKNFNSNIDLKIVYEKLLKHPLKQIDIKNSPGFKNLRKLYSASWAQF